MAELELVQFDDKKPVGSYSIVKNITANDVENIMVTALEGGIGYWAELDVSGEFAKDRAEHPTMFLSQYCVKRLLEGKELVFTDAESEDVEEQWVLTLDKLLYGLAQNATERPADSDIHGHTFDAGTTDCIVQYALFRKLVFG